nr:hypothetical protein [Neorhizobium tomejilense]
METELFLSLWVLAIVTLIAVAALNIIGSNRSASPASGKTRKSSSSNSSSGDGGGYFDFGGCDGGGDGGGGGD